MDLFAQGHKIYNQALRSQRVLLIAHQRPDADALGSVAAFSYWLNKLGKQTWQYCQDQIPPNLLWLNNYQQLETDWAKLLDNNFDLVFILDCGDLKYAAAEDLLKALPNRPFVINIDHHESNRMFGDLNLVDSSAASTTAIIFELFKIFNLKLDEFLGNALLAGIVNDTYNFTNPNTSQESLQMASELLRAGACLNKVSDAISKTKTVEALKSWGQILSELTYNQDLNLAITVAKPDDDDSLKTDLTEGVANFLNNLGAVNAVLILQQADPETIKGSLRTNSDLIDVGLLAKILGGGGHRKAAGFKIKGQLIKQANGNWLIQ